MLVGSGIAVSVGMGVGVSMGARVGVGNEVDVGTGVGVGLGSALAHATKVSKIIPLSKMTRKTYFILFLADTIINLLILRFVGDLLVKSHLTFNNVILSKARNLKPLIYSCLTILFCLYFKP